MRLPEGGGNRIGSVPIASRASERPAKGLFLQVRGGRRTSRPVRRERFAGVGLIMEVVEYGC
jgi:hypothetical protein